jgi:hypothetical protein
VEAKINLCAPQHSGIARQLLANTPIRVVPTLHGTSVELAERTCAKFITDHSNTRSRRACSTPPNRSAKMIRLEGAT